MKRIALSLPLGLLGACTYNGVVQLYPANDEAAGLGPFTVEYKDVGKQGRVDFSLPDGEHVSGTYTSVDNSLIGHQWGQVYAALPETSVYWVTHQTTSIRPSSMLGRLDGYGNRGTSVTCEYVVDRRTRGGLGTCLTSTGAIYQMHFSIRR